MIFRDFSQSLLPLPPLHHLESGRIVRSTAALHVAALEEFETSGLHAENVEASHGAGRSTWLGPDLRDRPFSAV